MSASDWKIMRKQDAPAYQVLMAFIIRQFETLSSALRFIGISQRAYESLIDDCHIRLGNAQKIMTAYSKVKMGQHVE